MNKKGLIAVLFSLLLIGGGLYFFTNQKAAAPREPDEHAVVSSQNDASEQIKEAAQESTTPTSNTEIDTSSWKTYRNEEYGFEVRYPSKFTVSTEKENEVVFTHRLIGGHRISIERYNCENISIDQCSVRNIFDVSGESIEKAVEDHDYAGEFRAITVADQKAKTFIWFTIGDGARLILVPHPTKNYLYELSVSFGSDPGSGITEEDVALDTETVSMLLSSFKFIK